MKKEPPIFCSLTYRGDCPQCGETISEEEISWRKGHKPPSLSILNILYKGKTCPSCGWALGGEIRNPGNRRTEHDSKSK